jgi:cytochrome c-type biogenesis protein CcmH
VSDGLRRLIAAIVTLVAVGVIIWGVAVGDGRGADRVDSLAGRLRCPVCQGESIADSGAELARNYRDLIAEEVATGATDDAIIDLFVARYGDWVLLDPPARGRTLVLWALPALALAVGLGAVATRRRPAARPPGPPATTVEAATGGDGDES